MKTEKEENRLMKTSGQKFTDTVRAKISALNNQFNSLSLRAKQAILLFFGMSMAMLCLVLVVRALQSESPDSISIEKITLPNDIHMNSSDTTQNLIPLGKFKGEIDGEFEAFYLAVDGEGQAYINRNPVLGPGRFVKSKEWRPVSRQQLEAYEKDLHFIPHKSKALKP